jgi:hypothetical protein
MSRLGTPNEINRREQSTAESQPEKHHGFH